MALATSEHHPDAPRQPASPNVARQGAQPVAEPAAPAMPVLFDDLDPVLLVRLYPEIVDVPAARTAAMAAGTAAREQGMELVASQNEPVVVMGEPVAPPPHRSGPGPQREA